MSDTGEVPPIPLEDSFRSVKPTDNGETFSGLGKLDYIFVSQGANVIDANIDRSYYGPASDHWPISATIKLT